MDFSIKYHQLAALTVVMSLRSETNDGQCALQVEDSLVPAMFLHHPHRTVAKLR